MAVVFSYHGSTATTVTFSRDPIVGGYRQTRMWKSPTAISGGGVRYIYDKGVKRDIVTLTWNPIEPTDLANLITFFGTVGGSDDDFDFTDPLGVDKPAMLWGPNSMSWTPSDIMDREFTIDLLVLGNYLVDESSNNITDESENHLIVD